jgi:8-oxo-dGTP pyrophosphatase MutT (NUDIX family)
MALDQSPLVRIVSRHRVASNTKWHANFDRIADDFGNEVIDYLTLQPVAVNPSTNISGVSVVPIVDGQIVLLYNYRHPIEAGGWEVVRGFIDEDETPVVAALRELTEETGLTAPEKNLIPLGYSAPEPSTIAGKSAMFAAVDCHGEAKPDTTEIGLGKSTQFDPSAISKMLTRFEIEDGSTEIALRRYLALSG